MSPEAHGKETVLALVADETSEARNAGYARLS